jgi:hypothetical protein
LSSKIHFDEEAVRAIPGFAAVWERDLSLADLPRRRQIQRIILWLTSFSIVACLFREIATY